MKWSSKGHRTALSTWIRRVRSTVASYLRRPGDLPSASSAARTTTRTNTSAGHRGKRSKDSSGSLPNCCTQFSLFFLVLPSSIPTLTLLMNNQVLACAEQIQLKENRPDELVETRRSFSIASSSCGTVSPSPLNNFS